MGIGSLKQDAWSTNILQVASKQYTATQTCLHILNSNFSILFATSQEVQQDVCRLWRPQTPKSQPPFPFNPGANHQDTFEWETKVCVHLGMKPVTLMETMSPALALFTASRVTPRTTVISLENFGDL